MIWLLDGIGRGKFYLVEGPDAFGPYGEVIGRAIHRDRIAHLLSWGCGLRVPHELAQTSIPLHQWLHATTMGDFEEEIWQALGKDLLRKLFKHYVETMGDGGYDAGARAGFKRRFEASFGEQP